MKKQIYHASKGLFGTAHLVFTAAADMALQAEVAVTKRTGVWEGNTQYKIETEEDVESIIDRRIEKTYDRIMRAKKAQARLMRKTGYLKEVKL